MSTDHHIQLLSQVIVHDVHVVNVPLTDAIVPLVIVLSAVAAICVGVSLYRNRRRKPPA